MALMWTEVRQAIDEKRCELVLTGPEVSKRIAEDGLDYNIFTIKHLNFLEISNTGLEVVPKEIGDMTLLTRLILRNNKLQTVPSSIGNLKKLKFFDASFNGITNLPEEISTLTDLQSLNFSSNKLTALPDLSQLVNLISLNIAKNDFEEFPNNMCQNNLIHFSELIANNNKIKSIPPEINLLKGLKVFNLSENSLTDVPGELADCTKLKELNLKGNKLKDKRLTKLIDQCHGKQVMEYIRGHCQKASTDESKQAKSKKKAKQNKKAPENSEAMQQLDQIKILRVEDDTVKIICTPNVQDIRPHFVACIIHDLKFESKESLKKFITMQTRLHESICEKRTLSTIATHDLSKVIGNVHYDAKEPNSFKIQPLNKTKEMTAAELYSQLNNEADALRKEKKKNTYSGIHKYLYLLKDKPLYPCITDDNNRVISFPPITNSDVSKVSEETQKILVEVTGSSPQNCKDVMEALLLETVKLGIGGSQTINGCGDGDEITQCSLTVQQVKVVDEEGRLKVVYPSRVDIQTDKVNVIRPT